VIAYIKTMWTAEQAKHRDLYERDVLDGSA